MKIRMHPVASWEVFDICDTCGTDKGKPCYNLEVSTSKKLIPTTFPHRGRQFLPKCTCKEIIHDALCPRWEGPL